MWTALRSVGLGALMILVGAEAMPPRALAQDATQQQDAKRKVKKRVDPTYPDIARRMGLTGKVRIQVVINAEGRVTSTKELGGSPVLVNAAEQAVKEWSFEPGPSETTEIVEFTFTGS